jgi:hypothetical protein
VNLAVESLKWGMNNTLLNYELQRNRPKRDLRVAQEQQDSMQEDWESPKENPLIIVSFLLENPLPSVEPSNQSFHALYCIGTTCCTMLCYTILIHCRLLT